MILSINRNKRCVVIIFDFLLSYLLTSNKLFNANNLNNLTLCFIYLFIIKSLTIVRMLLL